MNSTKWKVAWNTVSQLFGKAIGSGAMLLVSIFIAREFGAQGYGDFTKITTFVAFFISSSILDSMPCISKADKH